MYANFFDGEPNNGGNNQDCLVIGVKISKVIPSINFYNQESDGEWRDQLCSKTSQFLCETAATEGGASITPAPTTIGTTIGEMNLTATTTFTTTTTTFTTTLLGSSFTVTILPSVFLHLRRWLGAD